MKLIISFLLTLSFITQLKAQESICDSIYTFESLTEIAFHDDNLALVYQNIIPPLAELIKEYDIYITSLPLKFIINEKGKIEEVIFLDEQIPSPYRQKIIDNLIQNTQWKPAAINGNPVCSELLFPISCLKWQ